MFVLQFWYILALGLVKLSILCLYGRLFSAGRYPVAIKVFLVLTSAWLVSFVFATFFQVWPLSCNWVNCTPTTNYTVMYVCLSVTDVLLDIAILCIPTSFIRTLHISKGQKISLVGIFGLGVLYVTVLYPPYYSHRLIQNASCIIASIARLSYAVRYVQVNIEGNYQVNFAGMLLQGRILRLAEHNRPRRQHDHVVWYRSLRFYHMRQPPLLRTPFETGPQPQVPFCQYTIRFHLATRSFLPSQLAEIYISGDHFDGKARERAGGPA